MTAELERQCAEDPRATFGLLSPAQLRGEECPVCWRHGDVPIPHLGGNVRACGEHAWQLGFRPEDGWQGGRS